MACVRTTSSNYLERIRKGIGQSASCQICHHESKDLVHVLRDFLATKEAWMQIVPANLQWQIKCILRKRNKVADRLAKVASDRNTDVQLFVNFLEEMLDEFGFDKVVEYPFCLKALSTPKVIASMDTTQLGTLIMKLGAANVKATLNVYNEIIKEP
ncbi:hypothetical protein Gogos_020032, partial [Gossypium gossypioides]|nr:hypothetical protein [Gossypium gossypioides]